MYMCTQAPWESVVQRFLFFDTTVTLLNQAGAELEPTQRPILWQP